MCLDQGRAIEIADPGDRHLDLQLGPIGQCLDHCPTLVPGGGIQVAAPGLKSTNCKSGPPPNKAPSSAKGAVTAFSRILTKIFQMVGPSRNVGSSSVPL